MASELKIANGAIVTGTLNVTGNTTLDGNVTLGNATGDDVTVTGSLASSIPIKTTNTVDIGSADLGLASIYFGTADADTVRIVAAAQAADRTYTLPDAGAAASFVMTAGAQSITGAKTFTVGQLIDGTADQIQLRVQGHTTQTSDVVTIEEGTGGTNIVQVNNAGLLTLAGGIKPSQASSTLSVYTESTWTPTVQGDGTPGTHSYTVQVGTYTRIGRVVFIQAAVQIGEAANNAGGGGASVGSVVIGGLPFTANSTSGIRFALETTFSDIDLSAGYTTLKGQISASGTTMALVQCGDNVAQTGLPVAQWDSLDCFIRMSGYYFV